MIINKINLTRKMTKKEYLEKIGARIIEIREEKGFAKEVFADKLGISRMQLYRIENGKVNTSIGAMRDICSALNIKMIELLDIED